LTSQGRDRLDLLRYGPWHSGKERLTGEAVLAALPEAARTARSGAVRAAYGRSQQSP